MKTEKQIRAKLKSIIRLYDKSAVQILHDDDDGYILGMMTILEWVLEDEEG